jgi:class 3 adenylate cyclase/pimeloyl-ACP methyl ester carboxylesterase
MDPKVQYTTTRDGVSIAYWDQGEGLPLVIPPPALPWSNILRELDIPAWRHWYEHLADMARIIRYDVRGAGLSDRDVTALPFESQLWDLEAVVEAAKLDRFAIEGFYYSGLAAITYAARNPDRVSHLILWCAFPNAESVAERPGSGAFRQLLDTNYELFTETMTHQLFGWGSGESAHQVASLMRESLTPELARTAWDEHAGVDVTPLLSQVQCPTLVMQRRQFELVPVQQARQLASAIPNARLCMLDGASLAPFVGDIETPLREMARFLGIDDGAVHALAHETASSAGGFRAIMFTDIEGSTATTQQVGDAAAQEMVRTHNEIVRRALHRFSGAEVKHTGDGIMASFFSAASAIECAMAIQRGLAAHSALNQNHPQFAVRIGINAGEPVVEGGDLFGTAVQVASRICTRADARQILVSDVVRQLVAGKGFLFADQGESDLRGFEDPVRLFEVRWHEED